MLGQPVSMLLPQVVGFRLEGELPEGATATDLVLTVTEMLRERGVVGSFVEFYGPGPGEPAARRPRDDRQHVAGVRLDLRDLPGRRRDAALPRVLRPAGRARSSWSRPTRASRGCSTTSHRGRRSTPTRSSSTSRTVEPSLAGPKRPQDRIALSAAAERLPRRAGRPGRRQGRRPRRQRARGSRSRPATRPPRWPARTARTTASPRTSTRTRSPRRPPSASTR